MRKFIPGRRLERLIRDFERAQETERALAGGLDFHQFGDGPSVAGNDNIVGCASARLPLSN